MFFFFFSLPEYEIGTRNLVIFYRYFAQGMNIIQLLSRKYYISSLIFG
jgi:hypothetical protein